MGIKKADTPGEVVRGHIAEMRAYARALESPLPLVKRGKIIARIRKCADEAERAYRLALIIASRY